MSAPQAGRLDALQRLIGAHAEAVRAGDADALPALSAQLRSELGAMLRQPPAAASPEHAALAELQRLCLRTQALLARRQLASERALQALAAGAAGARELQAQRVYAPEGRLAGGRPVGRGLGSA